MNKHLYNCKMIFMATASIEIEKCKPIFLKNFDELSQKNFMGHICNTEPCQLF